MTASAVKKVCCDACTGKIFAKRSALRRTGNTPLEAAPFFAIASKCYAAQHAAGD